MSKSKYNAEERVRVVEACISGRLGQSEAARQLGADESTIREWIGQYSIEGVSAFLSKEHNNHYNPELKETAVKEYLSGGGSLREICKKYKIRNKSQLQMWIKVYNGHKDFKKQTGGSRMTKGRETTQAERIAVAKACIANGKNYGEVAKTFCFFFCLLDRERFRVPEAENILSFFTVHLTGSSSNLSGLLL